MPCSPLINNEKIIYEYTKIGCSGVDFQNIKLDKLMTGLPKRESIGLPELSEPEVVRHFTNLSRENYSPDMGIFPLGSCTMKYSPKINDKIADFDGFSDIHPMQDESTIQGALEAMYMLQCYLSELSGLSGVALSPAAGAHGEFAGMRVIKAAHKRSGKSKNTVLIPETAHGTNPATAAMCGYNIVTLKPTDDGITSAKSVADAMSDDVAAVMLTVPNTCGLFENEIMQIADIIHNSGAYLYCDGANFNAFVSKIKPSDFGVDVMHFNLHKTFSTPHGGGGPGCGPIAVCEELKSFMPTPYVIKKTRKYSLVTNKRSSIGRVKAFHGHFSVMIRALAYIMSCGLDGLNYVAEYATLNANYILYKLRDYYNVPFNSHCMHECFLTDKEQRIFGINNTVIAKTLMENGMHPMTISFPIILPGGMLIEPTENESKESLDKFINVMIDIANKVKNLDIKDLVNNPKNTPVLRVDEAGAAIKPKLVF